MIRNRNLATQLNKILKGNHFQNFLIRNSSPIYLNSYIYKPKLQYFPIRSIMNTTINFFSGNPLNRKSPIRAKPELMNELLTSPTSKFILFSKERPLFTTNNTSLNYLNYQHIKPLLNDLNPYELSSLNKKEESSNNLLRISDRLEHENGVNLVFLGLDERSNIAYWAIRINDTPEILKEEKLSLLKDLPEGDLNFLSLRPAAFFLPPEIAAILGQATAMLDWNVKTQFCSVCGSKTASGDSGYKRVCLSLLDPSNGPQCISSQRVMNFSYPRTDGVAIVAVHSKDNQKLLLGRKKEWPPSRYSCIAGFLEPAESLEEAAQREVKEETGVNVTNVRYHSSQPWPFPSNLMIGCFAEATSEDIFLDDEELEDARWFTRKEVQDSLIADANKDADHWINPKSTEEEKVLLKLPPKMAIAYTIISAWANDTFPNKL